MDTQPGQVITPQENKTSSPSEVPGPTSSAIADSTSTVIASGAPPKSDSPSQRPQSQTVPRDSSLSQNDWQHRAQEGGQEETTSILADDIQWEAAEFIEHPKDTRWYALLVLAGIVIAAVDYLVTRDIVSTVVIAIAAAMFGFYAGRKPHTRQYHLGPEGLRIGEKAYSFQSYKHFSVIDEGDVSSIVFMPMKRFEVPLTIYVSTNIEEQVIDYLSAFLPMERHHIDAVDGLLRRIRF